MSDLRNWIYERVEAGENLTRPQLTALAVALGAEPRFWADRVHHDPNTRYFHQLYRDLNVDVWLICWLDAQDTGYHDHDLSSGAVHVVGGALCEDYFHRDAHGWIQVKTRERPAGDVFDFDGSSIHGMRHAGGAPATSIHVYSPALWRMGYYEPGEGGVRRSSITYADELASGGSLPAAHHELDRKQVDPVGEDPGGADPGSVAPTGAADSASVAVAGTRGARRAER